MKEKGPPLHTAAISAFADWLLTNEPRCCPPDWSHQQDAVVMATAVDRIWSVYRISLDILIARCDAQRVRRIREGEIEHSAEWSVCTRDSFRLFKGNSPVWRNKLLAAM